MKKVYCLTPLYNDWESCAILLQHLEKLQEENENQYKFSLVIVNDGSSDENDNIIPKNASLQVTLINLKINIGHQRAIAVGLQYIHNEINDFDYLVVMDSDGEDKPEDIPTLLNKSNQNIQDKIIFAQRNKRQESLLFKIGYFFYKKLFNYLTDTLPIMVLILIKHQQL